MLVPLFGLQMLITIYRPDPSVAGSQLYEIATTAVANSQVLKQSSSVSPVT